MRLSVHSERLKGSANHADRQFDYIKYAPHIDPTKVKDNIYIGKENLDMKDRILTAQKTGLTMQKFHFQRLRAVSSQIYAGRMESSLRRQDMEIHAALLR